MKIIVTRHPALVDYLREIGLADENTPVITHASEDQIRGKHVIGVLPLHLAAVAESVTIIPLALTPELRGQELDLETVRRIAGAPRTFLVGETALSSSGNSLLEPR